MTDLLKSQSRTPTHHKWIATFRNPHLEAGINFNELYPGIPSDSVW